MFPFRWTPREKWIATIGGVLVVCLGIYLWTTGEEEPLGEGKVETYQAQEKASPPKASPEKKTTEIVVDVKGAVKRPGIYTFSQPTRIYQVIEQAGGVLPEGDTNSINLAEQVVDGTALYIPKKGEQVAPSTGSSNSPSTNAAKKININTATVEQLDQLNGLGPTKAKAIIEYRQEHGKFQKLEDLTKVPRIGEKTIEQFRDQVEVK